MRRLIAVLFLKAKNLNHLNVYYQPFLLRSSAIKGRKEMEQQWRLGIFFFLRWGKNSMFVYLRIDYMDKVKERIMEKKVSEESDFSDTGFFS